MSKANRFQEAINKLRTHAESYDIEADGAKYASEAIKAENSAAEFRRAALYLEGQGKLVSKHPPPLYTSVGGHCVPSTGVE
tara:strand:- start:1214 stop:1456 length:243 start_codon:yes stop_codon:yes gene_type:complete